MHILILGATGRTGSLLVNEALKRGHKVNVMVRNKLKLTTDPELLDIYEGTPLNIDELVAALQGCDAVLSTLNISRTSDFPWAPLRTGKDFLSLSMKNILKAADHCHVKRIIVTSAWGVAETSRDIPFWFRWLIRYSNIYYAYHDHEHQEELLKNSDMNWTAVRPVGLVNSRRQKEVKVTLNNTPKPSLTISRLNVARFMLDALEQNLYNRQFPVISEK